LVRLAAGEQFTGREWTGSENTVVVHRQDNSPQPVSNVTMLILTRKAGQAIQIANDILIVIKSVQSNRVAIGVQAPADVKILRTELRSGESVAIRPH
jgi:carbon storage regulator CsrA